MNRFWLVLAALVIGMHPGTGESETIDAGNVTVEFDKSTFDFVIDSFFFSIPPEDITVTGISDGVLVDLNNQMLLSDFAEGESDPNDPISGRFDASFSFTPKSNVTISGYRVTIEGTQDIDDPGEANYHVTGVGGEGFFTPAPETPFSTSYAVSGSVAPPIEGTIEATAYVDYVSVQVGTEEVYVGSEFIPDPSCTDPDPGICPDIEVPIFEEVPIFMDQAVLGAASINLQRIRIVALHGLTCDFNGDGSVDSADAGILFADWGSSPGSPADKNSDGVVDAADAGILFSEWTGDGQVGLHSADLHPIPEPSATLLAFGAAMTLLARGRKTASRRRGTAE